MNKWFVIIEENELFHTISFTTKFEAMKYIKNQYEDGTINGNENLYIAEGKELLLFKEMIK